MEPMLCANGCGFFGTAENRHMCSKCYKDFLMKEIISPSSKSIATVEQPDYASSSPESQNDIVVSEIAAQFEGLTVGRSRCKSCNKKVGLTGFRCRCGASFCGRHRLPEVHACNVNYKTIPGRNDKDLAQIITGDKLGWRA